MTHLLTMLLEHALARLERGFRILSAYITSADERLWVLIAAGRSATTILLAGEY